MVLMGSAWEMNLQPIIGLISDNQESKDFPSLCDSWMKRCSAPALPQSAFNHQQQPVDSRLKDEYLPRGNPNNLQRQKQRESQCMSQLWSSSTTLENSNTSWEGDWSTSSGTPPIPKSAPSPPEPYFRHRTGLTAYPSGSDWSPGESSASNSVSSSYGMMQSPNTSASSYYESNGYNYNNSGYNNYGASGGYHQYQQRRMGDAATAGYNRNPPMSAVKQPVQDYYRRQGRYGMEGMPKIQVKTEPEDYTEAENFTSLFTTSLTSLYSGDNENTFSEDKNNYDPDIMICTPPPTAPPRIIEDQSGFQRMPVPAGSLSSSMVGSGYHQDPRGNFGFFENRTPQNFQPQHHHANTNQDLGSDANRTNSFRYDRPSFDDMHLYAPPPNDTKVQPNKKRKVSIPNIPSENNFMENHRKKTSRGASFKSESQWTPNNFAFGEVRIKQEPIDDYSSNDMEIQRVSFKDNIPTNISNGSKTPGPQQDHPKPPPRKRSPASTCFDRFDKKSTPSNKKVSPLSVYAKIQESIVLSVKCRRYKKRTKPATNKEEAVSVGKEEMENYKRTSLTPDQAARQVVDELLERVSLFGERSGVIHDLDQVDPNRIRELIMQFCRRYSLDYRDFEDVGRVLQPRILKDKIAKNSARASAIRKRTSTSPVLSSDKAEPKKQVKKEDSTPSGKQRVLRSLPGRTDRGRSRSRRLNSNEQTPQRRYSTRSVKDVDDTRCSDDDIVIDSSTDRESEAGKEAEVRKKSKRIQNMTVVKTPAKARSTERAPAKVKANKKDESRTQSKEKKAESPKEVPRNKRSRTRQANSRDSLRSTSIEVVDITRSNSPSPPLMDILKMEPPSLSKVAEKVKGKKSKLEETSETSSPNSSSLPATRRSRQNKTETSDIPLLQKPVNLKRKQEESDEALKRTSKKTVSICASLKSKNSAKVQDSNEKPEASFLDSPPKLHKKSFDFDSSINTEISHKVCSKIKTEDGSRTEAANSRKQLKEKGRKYLLDAPSLEPVLPLQLPIKTEKESPINNTKLSDSSKQLPSKSSSLNQSQLEDNVSQNKVPQNLIKSCDSIIKRKPSHRDLSSFINKIKEEKLDELISIKCEKADCPVKTEEKRPVRAVRTLPIKKLPRRRSSQLSDSELQVVLRKLPDSQINGSVHYLEDGKSNQVNGSIPPHDVKLLKSNSTDKPESVKMHGPKPEVGFQKIQDKETNEKHSNFKKSPELFRVEKVPPLKDSEVSIIIEENRLSKALKKSDTAISDSKSGSKACKAGQPKVVMNHRRSESEDSDCGLVIDLDRRQSVEERVPSPTLQTSLLDSKTAKKDPNGNSRQHPLVLNPFVHDATEEAHILLQLSRGGLPPFPPDEYSGGSPEDSSDKLCLPPDIEDTIKKTAAEVKGPERDESILRTLLLETTVADSAVSQANTGEETVDSKAHFNQEVLKFLMHEAYQAMPLTSGGLDDDKKIPFVNFLVGQLQDMNANLLSCAEEMEDDPNVLREEIIKLRNEIVYLQCMANQKDRERTAIVCFKRYKEEILRRLVKKYTQNVNAQEQDEKPSGTKVPKKEVKSSAFDPTPSTSSASNDIVHSHSSSNLQLIQMTYRNTSKTDTPSATVTSKDSLCAGENLPTVATMVANATENYGVDMRTVSRSGTGTTILQEALSSRESNYSPSTSRLSLSPPVQRLGESIQILQKALTSGRDSNFSPSGPSRSPSLPELSPTAKSTHRSYSKLSSSSSQSPPNLQPETNTRSPFTSFKQHYPLALVASETKQEVSNTLKTVPSIIKSRDSTPIASPRSSPKHGGSSYSAWNNLKTERKTPSTTTATLIDLRTEHVKAQEKLKSSKKRSSSSTGHKFMVVPPPTTLQESSKYGSRRTKLDGHSEKPLQHSMERIYRHDTEQDRQASFSSVVSVSSSIAVVSSPLSSPPRCMGCGISDAKFICSGCRDHWYCSAQCQTMRWPDHSRVCVGSVYSSSPSSKYT